MMNSESRPAQQTKRLAQGLRRTLVAATALAGGFMMLDVMIGTAVAQQVLLAPLGSHRTPSAAVPVYPGATSAVSTADQGQNDPSPLATPPEFGRPASLSPLAPVANRAPDPSAANDTSVLPMPVRQVPVRATAPNAPLLAADPDVAAEPVITPRPRRTIVNRLPTVQPGDAPVFPAAPIATASAPALYTGRRQIPEELRYRGADSQGYRARDVGVADAGPLLPATVGPAPLPPSMTMAANDPARVVPYVPVGAAASSLNTSTGIGSVDPLTQVIDRSISSLRAGLAPSIQAGTDFSGHNGSAGLSKLAAYSMPIEGVFSPAGVGKMKLTVTPVYISAGRTAGNSADAQAFGTQAFGLTKPTVVGSTYTPSTYIGPRAGEQSAYGTGLDLRYTVGAITADIGSTPIGFQEQNIIGGVEFAPMITDHTRLRFSVDRRAVTETYLSYAGTTDPYSGKRWGGVVKTGGKASIESSIGLWNTFAQAGGAMFTGNNVASNADYELSAGATYPIWSYNKEELRTGVETHYTSYNKNLRYFTYGQGGYFSPQRFITVLAPITYRNQVGYAFSYQLDGAVGYQEFSEKSSPYYPTSQSLQKQLEAVTGNPLLNTSYTPHRGSGITGTVAARGEYRVTPNFTIGAGASFGNAGVYQSYGGNVYGRYVFNDFYDR